MSQATGTGKYESVLERCRGLTPIPTAVAYPCEQTAQAGAIDAARGGLITPILVGPATKVAEIARASGITLGETEIVDVPVIRTSRADSLRSRIASCAVAVLAAHARRRAAVPAS